MVILVGHSKLFKSDIFSPLIIEIEFELYWLDL